jgi:hypothetical protein
MKKRSAILMYVVFGYVLAWALALVLAVLIVVFHPAFTFELDSGVNYLKENIDLKIINGIGTVFAFIFFIIGLFVVGDENY